MRSVAKAIFLSRWDSLIDKQLDRIGTRALALRGKAGVAWPARPTSTTWPASTVKAFAPSPPAAPALKACCGPAPAPRTRLPDPVYVEPLIGPETVNPARRHPGSLHRPRQRHRQHRRPGRRRRRRPPRRWRASASTWTRWRERLQQDGLAQFATAFGKLLELTA